MGDATTHRSKAFFSTFLAGTVLLFFCYTGICSPFLFSSVPGFAKDTTITIYFRTASFELDTAEKEKLNNLFRNHPAASLTNIEGYADTVGSTVSNLKLSTLRSAAVMQWLHQKFPSVIKNTSNDYGESRPASASSNALNRRVVITVDWAVTNGRPSESRDSGEMVLVKKLVLDQLYFKPDKAVLESRSIDYLRQVTTQLKTYPHARFEINGHVNYSRYKYSSAGFQQQMQQLSEDRAKCIYQDFVDHGIPSAQMTYRGLGNQEMIYPDPKNEDEKRMNMRVEILVYDRP